MKKGLITLFSLLLLLITGCSEAPSESAQSSDHPTVKLIKVGTMGTYEPFSYQDKNGRLTGYDIEVLRAIEQVLTGYKFEFISSPWDSLFIGLDADKFQLLANQMTRNPEREARYALNKKHYFMDMTQLIIHKDNDTIQSIEDLHGKYIGSVVGDSHTRILEEYNQQHGNPIKIQYYETDSNTILQDIINGRVAATVNNPIMAIRKAQMLNLAIKPVGKPLIKHPAIFIAKKDEQGQKLIDDIDHALTLLQEAGILSQLSKEWFGED